MDILLYLADWKMVAVGLCLIVGAFIARGERLSVLTNNHTPDHEINDDLVLRVLVFVFAFAFLLLIGFVFASYFLQLSRF